ncbi:plasminogen activator inhibitor 1-like [Epargyreus clarus]|uniref:plasminogen activator inhibitor 1-like n=1 Tax=Epargyreus clarus TaxID=520877 RepID=UPI003C2B0E6B
MLRSKYFALYYAIFAYIAITLSGHTVATAEILVGSNELVNALNNFGYKLTVQLLKETNDNTNVVISPTGINGVLAMVLLGSVGRSYDELSDILGFSQDVLSNRKYHEQLGQLLKDLNNNDTYSKTMYANAIFVDTTYKLREVYRSYLSKVYNGEAMSVDFKDSSTVKTLINEWVSNNTNGKLPEFLKQDLPADTQAGLLSALYFNGQWEVPFVPEHTKKLPFTTLSGDKVMIDQMLNMGKFKYGFSADDGFDILALSYNDSVTTLYAVRPTTYPKKQTIRDLMNSIDYNKINNMIDQMNKKQCIIRFPKMDLQSDLKLEDSLKTLGIKSIFSPSEANFALMVDVDSSSNDTDDELIQRINDGDKNDAAEIQRIINGLPNPRIYVDTVVHSVKMTIDEYGTEASSATGAFLARSVQMFYLDSPFYMFIRNEKTKLVTFSAVILNPSD